MVALFLSKGLLRSNLHVLKSLCTSPLRMIARNKAFVNGVNLYYEKVGKGNHPVLLFPGTFGSTKTDFEPQLQKLNRDLFTIIGFDPRGYGRSRPPDRDYPLDFLYRDADDAAGLMEVLGYDKYSIVGWSTGGSSACILAAKWTERVKKLVIWGNNSFITKDDLDIYEGIANPKNWSAEQTQAMINVYGESYFKKMCPLWLDSFLKMAETPDENGDTDLYRKELPKIKAEVMILYGMQEQFISKHHAEYLQKHIRNSRLVCWKDGKHNLHLRFPDRFNSLVEQFLSVTTKL